MKTFIVGTAALLLAGTAAAQVAAPAPLGPRDGIQTRAEAVQRVQTMFARVDANRDGFISADETQAMREKRKAAQGERRGNRRAAMFDRLDANRDNVISRDEWANAQAMRGQRQGMRGARMGQRGMGMGMLRMADTDRDNRVSLAEATAAAAQRFDRADVNRDGQVTREERQQVRRQWQQQRGDVRR